MRTEVPQLHRIRLEHVSNRLKACMGLSQAIGSWKLRGNRYEELAEIANRVVSSEAAGR